MSEWRKPQHRNNDDDVAQLDDQHGAHKLCVYSFACAAAAAAMLYPRRHTLFPILHKAVHDRATQRHTTTTRRYSEDGNRIIRRRRRYERTGCSLLSSRSCGSFVCGRFSGHVCGVCDGSFECFATHDDHDGDGSTASQLAVSLFEAKNPAKYGTIRFCARNDELLYDDAIESISSHIMRRAYKSATSTPGLRIACR